MTQALYAIISSTTITLQNIRKQVAIILQLLAINSLYYIVAGKLLAAVMPVLSVALSVRLLLLIEDSLDLFYLQSRKTININTLYQ